MNDLAFDRTSDAIEVAHSLAADLRAVGEALHAHAGETARAAAERVTREREAIACAVEAVRLYYDRQPTTPGCVVTMLVTVKGTR